MSGTRCDCLRLEQLGTSLLVHACLDDDVGCQVRLGSSRQACTSMLVSTMTWAAGFDSDPQVILETSMLVHARLDIKDHDKTTTSATRRDTRSRLVDTAVSSGFGQDLRSSRVWGRCRAAQPIPDW